MSEGMSRYYSHYKHRPTSFYNCITGGLYSEVSKVHRLEPMGSLEGVLEACDTRVLYLLPDDRGKYPTRKEWLATPSIKMNRFLDGRVSGQVEYKGKKIDFYPVGTWFTVPTGTQLKEVIQGYGFLRKVLEDNFQPTKVHQGKSEALPVELLATPSFMGSDLLKRSLPYAKEYPTLPEEELDTLLHNFGQGRVETFYHGESSLDILYNYDARWFYASCLRHVPTGAMVHDRVQEVAYTPYSKSGSRGLLQGFYKAIVTVPNEWNHIGLLPTIGNIKENGEQDKFPNKGGSTFETWCTSSELSLALKHEWRVEVQERILFPSTDKEPEPLKLWGERLIRVREEEALKYPEPFRSMIREASRNILLHTVGSFNRYAREYDGYALLPEVPVDAETIEPVKGSQMYHYTTIKPLSPLQQQLCKPEWSTWIWGVARKKLAEKALQVPFEKIVALRVDAIWSSQDMGFSDTGKVGEFRKKELKNNTVLVWPVDTANMNRIVRNTKEGE